MKFALILLTITIFAVNIQNAYSQVKEYESCANDDICGIQYTGFKCREGECKCEDGHRFLEQSKPDSHAVAGCVQVKDTDCANDNDCRNLKDSKCVDTKCSSSAFRNLQLSALFLSLFAVGILRF